MRRHVPGLKISLKYPNEYLSVFSFSTVTKYIALVNTKHASFEAKQFRIENEVFFIVFLLLKSSQVVILENQTIL